MKHNPLAVLRPSRLVRSRAAIGVLGVVAGLAIGGAGMAAASIPDPNGLVHGCVNNLTGLLRVIDPATGATCRTGETSLNFNQQGPAGQAGQAGPAGPAGPKGDKGDPAVSLFAHVTRAGDGYYGSGVTAVAHPFTGEYDVTFDRNVTGCVATGVVAGGPGETIPETVSVVRDDTTPDQLVIQVVDTVQDPAVAADAPIDVTVAC